MALLDVSDVLIDPDFMDTGLICERNTQTVGSNGLASLTTTQTTFAGVVTTDNGSILLRDAQGERIKGSITIHTKFTLDDGSSGTTADIVQWRGRRYTVTNVADYSHFGAGFVSAVCELIQFSG